jgi:hypothetical protein
MSDERDPKHMNNAGYESAEITVLMSDGYSYIAHEKSV